MVRTSGNGHFLKIRLNVIRWSINLQKQFVILITRPLISKICMCALYMFGIVLFHGRHYWYWYHSCTMFLALDLTMVVMCDELSFSSCKRTRSVTVFCGFFVYSDRNILKNRHGLFLWIGFNWLKATLQLWEDSLI